MCLLFVTIFVLTVTIWIYSYSGLREYNSANDKLNSLDSSGQLRVENYLNGSKQESRK